jgi:hypothetical protein
MELKESDGLDRERHSFNTLLCYCGMLLSGLRVYFYYGGFMNVVKSVAVAVAMCGLIAGGVTIPAFAGDNAHVKETIKHAKEGIEHEKEAIKHLEEAIKGSDNAHAKEALEHAKESMKHAEESLTHAEQSAQKPKGKAK